MSHPSSGSSVEGPIAKRQRLSSSSDVVRFEDDIPREVRMRILQFVATIEDLSNFAVVSRQSRDDCHDSSLPQSRVATIICNTRPDSTVASVLQTIRSAETGGDGGDGVFARFSHLKLMNHADLPRQYTSTFEYLLPPLIHRLRLATKTSLDLSLPPSVLRCRKEARQVHAYIPKYLAQIMPNLREVDMSYVATTPSALSVFARNCRNLEKIRWSYLDALDISDLASGQALQNCSNLKELYMDNSRFFVPMRAQVFNERNLFEEPDDPHCVLGLCLFKLERVCLKDATYYALFPRRYSGSVPRRETKPFSQVGLMKFVRAAGNLRWFRSDLTAENIAILQKERPEITFVS